MRNYNNSVLFYSVQRKSSQENYHQFPVNATMQNNSFILSGNLGQNSGGFFDCRSMNFQVFLPLQLQKQQVSLHLDHGGKVLGSDLHHCSSWQFSSILATTSDEHKKGSIQYNLAGTSVDLFCLSAKSIVIQDSGSVQFQDVTSPVIHIDTPQFVTLYKVQASEVTVRSPSEISIQNLYNATNVHIEGGHPTVVLTIYQFQGTFDVSSQRSLVEMTITNKAQYNINTNNKKQGFIGNEASGQLSITSKGTIIVHIL